MRHKITGIWGAALLAGGVLTLGGCATQEYVDQRVSATDARVAQIDADARVALARAEDAHKLAEGNFQHAVLFTDDTVKFDMGSADLSDQAKASLTAFADKIKSNNQNVYIEVQGHADTRGSEESNHQLGHARADSVVSFLSTQGIPVYHMSPTSYGETNPTGKGEAEDRRVVLVVMN